MLDDSLAWKYVRLINVRLYPSFPYYRLFNIGWFPSLKIWKVSWFKNVLCFKKIFCTYYQHISSKFITYFVYLKHETQFPTHNSRTYISNTFSNKMMVNLSRSSKHFHIFGFETYSFKEDSISFLQLVEVFWW